MAGMVAGRRGGGRVQQLPPCLQPVPLTNAGNVVLLDGEVQVKCVEGVSVIEHSKAKQAGALLLPPGLVVLTNYRVALITDDDDDDSGGGGGTWRTSSNPQSPLACAKVGWGFDLASVTAVEDCKTMALLGRSSRLHIELAVPHHTATAAATTATTAACIGLKFPEKVGEKDTFLASTRQFLAKRSWEAFSRHAHAAALKEQQRADEGFSTTQAGVAGLLRRQEDNLRAADELTREALGDLDSLMRRAREVASMVQRYASYAADRERQQQQQQDGGNATLPSSSSSSSGSSGGGTEGGNDEADALDAILHSIGIISPVTKSSAGKAFHQQLARQLADFLLDHDRLKRLGGMVTLTDMYGVFNRARGTELVSPDDFLRAVELVGALRVGVGTRRFPSGVHMLQLDEMRDDVLGRGLHELAQATSARRVDGLRAPDVARHYRVSLVVAREMLCAAETNGFLCRDDTVGGLAFFPNAFAAVQ